MKKVLEIALCVFVLLLPTLSVLAADNNKYEKDMLKITELLEMKGVLETTNAPQTESFLYTDNKTGTTFTVPANWSETDFSKERKFFSGKFTYDNDKGKSILYGGVDLVSMLPDEEKKELAKDELKNLTVDDYSAEELASMLELDSVGEVINSEIKTIGNVRYFLCVLDLKNSYGLAAKATCAYTLKDGYCFIFMFAGDNNSECYNDFISLVESVNYSSKSSKTDDSISIAPYQVILFFVILLLLIFITIVILIKKKSSKRCEVMLQNCDDSIVVKPKEKESEVQLTKNEGIRSDNNETLVVKDDSVLSYLEENNTIDITKTNDIRNIKATNDNKNEYASFEKNSDTVDTSINVGTVIERLEKLSKLKESGIINDREFECLKKDILDESK